MENKNKIDELEKIVLQKKKNYLVDILDPLVAGLDEMKNSFSNIFFSGAGENKINIVMEKYEKFWLKKKI